MDDDRVVPFKQLRRDDDVSDTGFVLKAQEHKSFGGSRALANDHRPHNLNRLAVGELLEPGCRRNSARIQLRTMLCQRMRTYGQPCAVKVGKDAFLGVHWFQW